MATVENRIASSTVFAVLISVTACHLINDTLQALMLAMYPMLRDSYALTFGQIGMITLVFQVTASILQPLIGHYTDRRPLPYSLPIAPAFTLLGLVLLGMATSYPVILVAAGAVGIGSAIFHPGGLARGTDCLGRALRHGAKPVPGRRQYRLLHRPAACRLDHPAARAGKRCLVRGHCPGRHWHPQRRRALVQPSSAPEEHGPPRACLSITISVRAR